MGHANIEFYDGSNVESVHPRQDYVFLIQAIEHGRITVLRGWFYADASWKALDEAQKEFGHCEIVRSILRSAFDAVCGATKPEAVA